MRSLITWGGWDGHEPDLVAKQFSEMLTRNGFDEIFLIPLIVSMIRMNWTITILLSPFGQ